MDLLRSMLAFEVSPVELVLRGTLMYWFLFLILRFVLRRDAGSTGIADILFVVIVADAAQNAMSAEYRTVAEGFLLVATLVAWNVLIDWASFRFDAFRKFAEPPPLLLVRHGRVIGRSMRKEFITHDDLQAQLRQFGVANIGDVRAAFMESDGKFSVILRSGRKLVTPTPPASRDGHGPAGGQ